MTTNETNEYDRRKQKKTNCICDLSLNSDEINLD